MASADEQQNHELSPPAAAADAAPTLDLITPAPTTPDEAEAETPKMAHDSMVTVRLSEPPELTLDTTAASHGDNSEFSEAVLSRDSASSTSNASSAGVEDSGESDAEKRVSTVSVVAPGSNRSLQDELADGAAESDGGSSSDDQDDQDEVNWEKLQKTEDEQTKDEETDNVSCHLNPPLRHPRHAIWYIC